MKTKITLTILLVLTGYYNHDAVAQSQAVQATQSNRKISLTLIPPSLVTNQVAVEIRGAIWNHENKPKRIDVAFYIDKEENTRLLHREILEVAANSTKGIFFRWPTKNYVGKHEIILVTMSDSGKLHMKRPLEIIDSNTRSTKTIGGAWVGITHWSEKEGKPWNSQIKKMTDEQWQELVYSMHAIGMDIIVIAESNLKNKKGKNEDIADPAASLCYYDSDIPNAGRVKCASKDPFDTILTTADELGMYVFLPLGSCQWKNYDVTLLEWSKEASTEQWAKYGQHPSFYGWYVAGEGPGDARDGEKKAIFFKELQLHCRAMAPDAPLMLAPNTIDMHTVIEKWRPVLEHCDIICPFGFHRFVGGEQTAIDMQSLADDVGAHLWMDVEVFLFDKEKALIPRPIGGLKDDLQRFPNFEKIICFQYPGLLTDPKASLKLGGDTAVTLYREYQEYLKKIKTEKYNSSFSNQFYYLQCVLQQEE